MTITLTTAQSQSFLNTVTSISYVGTMNGHRDIRIRRPLTLQSHVIKMTTSQNHVNMKTNIAGLYDYQHQQSRRLMQHHHKVTWIPWPTLQNYENTATMSQVTWKQWTTVHGYVTVTTAIIELCGCHHHHSRVIWRPLSLRYVETTIHFAEL